jgi:hypothetical protein
MEEFMKYAVEMGIRAMTYTEFHNGWLGDSISLLLFFQSKESRLKME